MKMPRALLPRADKGDTFKPHVDGTATGQTFTAMPDLLSETAAGRADDREAADAAPSMFVYATCPGCGRAHEQPKYGASHCLVCGAP